MTQQNSTSSVFGGSTLTDDQITGLSEQDCSKLSQNQVKNLTEDQKSSMIDRFGQNWQDKVGQGSSKTHTGDYSQKPETT